MTQEKINEGNRLIAEFMGSKYINDPFFDKTKNETVDFWHWSKPECGYLVTVGGIELSSRWQMGIFDFHHSWDALMPVVENIEAMGYSMIIEKLPFNYGRRCYLTIDGREHLNGSRNDNKLLSIYETVTQFITWHNKIKL